MVAQEEKYISIEHQLRPIFCPKRQSRRPKRRYVLTKKDSWNVRIYSSLSETSNSPPSLILLFFEQVLMKALLISQLCIFNYTHSGCQPSTLFFTFTTRQPLFTKIAESLQMKKFCKRQIWQRVLIPIQPNMEFWWANINEGIYCLNYFHQNSVKLCKYISV